jgi:SNF2 family DNA or RNA helicase
MFAFAERYEIRRVLPSVRGARITLPEKDYETIRKRLLSCGSDSYLLSARMDSIKSFYGVSREECMHILKNKEYTPFKNIDELWNRIGDTCIHLKKEDILDIPPKVYKTYKVDLTSEQKKLYLQLQNQHCTDNITVDNGLKLYLRFQDICNGYEPVETEETVIVNGEEKHKVELIPLKENPKLDLLEELVEDIGEEQIVVWCSRAKLLHDAKERLTNAGYTCGVYDGKVKREDREKDYSAFENKEIQILFVNQASGAYGLDGLKKANYAIYLCNSYSVEQREQSEDRIYRGLVSTNKYIIDLTCQGTCEDRVTEALKQGKQLLDTGMTDASLFILEE